MHSVSFEKVLSLKQTFNELHWRNTKVCSVITLL